MRTCAQPLPAAHGDALLAKQGASHPCLALPVRLLLSLPANAVRELRHATHISFFFKNRLQWKLVKQPVHLRLALEDQVLATLDPMNLNCYSCRPAPR